MQSSRTRDNAVTQKSRRSNHDIHANVSEDLRHTAGVDTHIRVAVNSGVVTLSGEVGSLAERLAAKRAAMRVFGVTAIADELQIRPPGTSGANDASIARAASQLLRSAADVPAGAVNAQVHNQVIILSGNVTWDYQRNAATLAVMNIKGVTGVANNVALHEAEPVP